MLPDLAGVPGVAEVREPVEHTLEAAYYDTVDLRLARGRVTLRRRTGGTDAGWHVKLPPVAGARRELHSPLGRAARTPPKAVLEPVLGIVRRSPVTQVATLRTRRLVTEVVDAEGRVLAEVADDHVTGTALPSGPGRPPSSACGGRSRSSWWTATRRRWRPWPTRSSRPAPGRPSPSKLSRVLADRLAAVDGPALPPAAERPAPAAGKKGKKGKGKKEAGRGRRDVVRAGR